MSVTKTTAMALFLFIAITTEVTAQNSLIEKLVAEIDQLKKDIAPLRALLNGSVIAFHRSEREGACPRGWQKFQPAAGRLIVGAGVNTATDPANRPLTDHPSYKDDATKAIGGEEVHALSKDELAKHNHKLISAYIEKGLRWKFREPGNDSLVPTPKFQRDSSHDWKSPGGAAHNNMPPYIALFYCIKREN